MVTVRGRGGQEVTTFHPPVPPWGLWSCGLACALGAGRLHLHPQAFSAKAIREVPRKPALIRLFLVSLFLSFQLLKFFFSQQCGHLERGCSGELNAVGRIFHLAPCEVVLQCVGFGQQCCSEFLISPMVPVVWEPVGRLGTSPEPGDAELFQCPRAFVLPRETSSPSCAQLAVGVGREQLVVGTCWKHCWLPKLVPCLLLFKNNGMLCSSGGLGTSGAVRATWLLRCCTGNALSRERLKIWANKL